MRRIGILTYYLLYDLSRAAAGIVPLALALAFGLIAFEYGMDQAQFITVAGVGIGAICLVSGLMLAGRSNRASYFPLLARVHSRVELLAALVVGSLAITAVLALLITVANLLAGRLTLDFPSVLWILPTWLALWLLAASLALPLSTLTSRSGSHLLGYSLLAALLVANDQKSWLAARGWDWMVRVVTAVLWPVSTLLGQASAGQHGSTYWLSLVLTCLYAALIFGLAAQLFADKDLLWVE
jgi:hypothetical protein